MAEIIVPLSQPSAQGAADCMLPTQYRSQFMSRTASLWGSFLGSQFSWQVAEDFNNSSWEVLADIVETRRSKNFGNLDWSKLIMPGEIRFCGCSQYLLPHGTTICGYCLFKPSVSDYVCGVCNKQADRFSIIGYRCADHHDVKEPFHGFTGENICGAWGRLRVNWSPQQAAMAQASTEHHHRRLKALRDSLAIHRLILCYAATFWMKQPELRDQAIKRLSMGFGAPPVELANEPDPIPAILELLKT